MDARKNHAVARDAGRFCAAGRVQIGVPALRICTKNYF